MATDAVAALTAAAGARGRRGQLELSNIFIPSQPISRRGAHCSPLKLIFFVVVFIAYISSFNKSAICAWYGTGLKDLKYRNPCFS